MELTEELIVQAGDVIILALALVIMSVFGYLAARAETQLWKTARRIEFRRQQQQSITEGKAHMR